MLEMRQKEAIRKPGLYTSQGKQARVIGAYLAGKSRLTIARDEHMNRGTVCRILSQTQVVELIEQYRQQMLELAPFCILALKDKLITQRGKLRKNMDWRMAIAILKGTGVFVSREVREQERPVDRFADWTDDDLDRFLSTGERPAIRPN
jgi:hypothetical protein